jgi:chromate transporter
MSFGGTAAHIAVLHDELVIRKQWISDEEFIHALSHCMILPGPEAQQLAIYIGWKLHGKKGGLAAGSLFVLPSMFIILALSTIYARLGRLPLVTAVLSVLRPGAVALVILAFYRVARRTLIAPIQWLAALAGFAAMVWLRAPIPAVMLGMALLGCFLGRYVPDSLALMPQKRVEETGSEQSWTELLFGSMRIAAVGVLLWLTPALLVYILSKDFSFWRQLTFFFTQAAFVTVGGSYTVIPYVAHLAVMRYHWLSASQMIDGFSLAETTPGPLILVVHSLASWLDSTTPTDHCWWRRWRCSSQPSIHFFRAFFSCLPAPPREKTQGNRIMEGGLRMIGAVVIAAMLNLALFLIRGALFVSGTFRLPGLNAFAVIWFAVLLLLLSRYRVSIGKFIVLSLLSGLFRWLLLLT